MGDSLYFSLQYQAGQVKKKKTATDKRIGFSFCTGIFASERMNPADFSYLNFRSNKQCCGQNVCRR